MPIPFPKSFPKSFPKATLKAAPAQIGGAWKLWRFFQTVSTQDIADEAARPFRLALVGTPALTERLLARLGRESPSDARPPADVRLCADVYARTEDAPPGSILLDAAMSAGGDQAAPTAALARIVTDRPDLRLALARAVPAFRPAVVSVLIAEAARENARLALVSAIPGVFPAAAFLLPATALGDLLALTRNQARLLLRIAAAYGRDVDLRARTRELLPIVGGAFGWRAAARELIGLVPGGIGLVVKGAVAYAGTYTVGRAAAIYYSTGHALSGPRLRQLYRDSYKEALGRVRALLTRARRR